MNARDEVLGRLKLSLRVESLSDSSRRYVSADYRRAAPADLDLFAERVADYRATVHRVGAGGLPEVVAAALSARPGGVVVPAGLPADWLSQVTNDVVCDRGQLDATALDACAGVLTGCAVAIAETGTIVLASPAQGRRAITLVPDYHLCVVLADQVVGSVPEALARLDPTGPLTFVSGPSATSDIELRRVEGVHGPRTLEVVVVSAG